MKIAQRALTHAAHSSSLDGDAAALAAHVRAITPRPGLSVSPTEPVLVEITAPGSGDPDARVVEIFRQIPSVSPIPVATTTAGFLMAVRDGRSVEAFAERHVSPASKIRMRVLRVSATPHPQNN